MTEEMKQIINSKEKHIAVIARAGCVDRYTEYYNGNSWVKISEYNGEEVMQYNKDGTVSMVQPLRYIKEPCEVFYKINNQVLTAEHRVVTDNGIHILLELLIANADIKIPLTFNIESDVEYSVLDIVCLFGESQDNHIYTIKTSLNNKYMEELLKGISYGKSNSNYTSTYCFQFKVKPTKLNLNTLSKIDTKMVFEYLKNIFNIRNNTFVTVNKNKGEFFQLLCHLNGLKTILSIEGNTYMVKFENSKFDCINHVYDMSKRIEKTDYKYCFTVSSGMLVLRRDGQIFITGNSGKSYTMVEYIKAHPRDRILYLVYNKEMKEEFLKKIKDIDCRATVSTIHSLAYRWYIKHYGKKQFRNINIIDVKNILKGANLNYGDISLIKFYYNMWLTSGVENVEEMKSLLLSSDHIGLLYYVQRVWEYYLNSNTIQHNVYLKLFQLSKDKIEGYDTILLDESNDSNSVMLSILVNNLDKKIIAVGDPLQTINSFNFTQDGLGLLIKKYGFKEYNLSMSFRVSEQVADLASRYLTYMYDKPIKFYGCKFTKITKLDLTRATVDNPIHLLCRTRLGGLREILDLLDKSPEKKIYYVGGLKGFGLDEIRKLLNNNGNVFIGGQRVNVNTLRKMIIEAEKNDEVIDSEIQRIVSLYDFGKDKEYLLSKLEESEVTNRKQAEIIVGTSHSSKGGTYKNVMLGRDFKSIEDIKQSYKSIKETNNDYLIGLEESEINLIYVALTRATHCLDLNDILNKKSKQKNRISVKEFEGFSKRG